VILERQELKDPRETPEKQVLKVYRDRKVTKVTLEKKVILAYRDQKEIQGNKDQLDKMA
jgi:hypothetical protein